VSASIAVIPGTYDVWPDTSLIHRPVPSKSPSDGSLPLPSISAGGLSPPHLAT
jgi:hypothetical protein